MTREEAIEEIKYIQLASNKRVSEALDMAISALEQQPCEDAEQIDYHDDFATCVKKISDYRRLNKMTDEEVYKRFVEPYHKFNKTEPCEDAVSRDAVKELIKSGVSTDTYDDVEQVCKWIDALPSVTQKSGKWINTADTCMSDNIVCSICGYDSIADYNYCPNCGARMVEPQESEDKE